MTASSAIRDVWNTVISDIDQSEGYFYRRLKQPSINTTYAGIVQPSGARRISLEFAASDFSPQQLAEESKGFSAVIGKLPGGQSDMICIHLTEGNSTFSSMFEHLCVDILNQWNTNQSQEEAVRAVLRRLRLWHCFFQRKPGLSREEYIGLYGELSVLSVLLKSGLNPEYAVGGWSGPLGSNQDFAFGTLALEVKTSTGNDLNRVKISNERQLDSKGISDLLLVHLAYDFRKDAGQTLGQIIKVITGLLADSPASLLFEERLLASGYRDEMHSKWLTFGFTERKRSAYRIEDGFPRITEAQLCLGLSRVSYDLSLNACHSWEMLFEDAVALARGTEVDV